MNVRPAAVGDRDRLLEWANDPVARAAGFRLEPIPADSHARWFARMLAEPAMGRIWIGIVARRPMGVVRVDRAADGVLLVSIAVAPEDRGKGHSGALLQAGLRAARRAFPGAPFRAWIRRSNAASIALFTRAGFQAPTTPPALPPGAADPLGAADEFIVLERD